VLDRTLMRVGNDEYARQNNSYGLTTLMNEHIELAGTRLRFSFRGKHGKTFDAEFADRRVAAVLRCARDSGTRPANRGALCQRTAMMTRRTTWHFVTFILHGSLQRMRRFLNEYWRSVLSNGIFMTAVAQNVDALEAISERQVSTGRRLRGMTSLQQGLATICCCHVVHNRPVEA